MSDSPKDPPELDSPLHGTFSRDYNHLLEFLFDHYEGPVFRFLYGLLRDHHAAEDALQETFIKAMLHIDRVAPQALRAWLFTVAHQQAMLVMRKTRSTPIAADDEALLNLVGNETADENAIRADDARAIRELLHRLPDNQQAVIRARFYEGKTFREIARAFGCPLNTALARLHEGLKKLRQLWEARYA